MESTKPQVIVTVHRPDLTEKERAKRMAEIKAATVRLFIAIEKQKVHKNKKGSKT